METKGKKKTSFTISPKQAHIYLTAHLIESAGVSDTEPEEPTTPRGLASQAQLSGVEWSRGTKLTLRESQDLVYQAHPCRMLFRP